MNIYVDGSYGFCSSGIQGGVGIYFEEYVSENLSITIVDNKSEFNRLDNQATEAIAVYIELLLTESINNIAIYSDCQHCVNCLTVWFDKFQNNGWITTKNKPIAQKYILVKCANIINDRKKKNLSTQINKVLAHSNIYGNERADTYAYDAMMNNSTTQDKIVLEYDTDISNNVASHVDLISLKNKFYRLNSISENYSNISYLDISYNYTSMDVLPTRTKYTSEELFSIKASLDETAKLEEDYIENSLDSMKEEDTDIVQESTQNIEDKNLEDGYLFFGCIECTEMILVRYSESKRSKLKRKLKLKDISTLTFTTCRNCISEDLSNPNTMLNVATDKIKSMKELRILPAVFEGSVLYTTAEHISGTKPTILTESNIVKYIPIDNIIKSCDKECTASTINVLEKKNLPYLQFGFI